MGARMFKVVDVAKETFSSVAVNDTRDEDEIRFDLLAVRGRFLCKKGLSWLSRLLLVMASLLVLYCDTAVRSWCLLNHCLRCSEYDDGSVQHGMCMLRALRSWTYYSILPGRRWIRQIRKERWTSAPRQKCESWIRPEPNLHEKVQVEGERLRHRPADSTEGNSVV